MTRKNCIHFLVVVFLAGIQFSSAQSTSESVASLRNSTDTCMAVFVQALKGAGSNPKHLLDGDLSGKAETAKSDLEALLKQIDSQTDIITKKEVGIASRGLSEVEKKELLTILAGQKKSFQELKGRVTMFQQKLAQFTKTDATRWKETYNSFESISGPQRAGEKLKSEIEAFLKSIPFARELEKKIITPLPQESKDQSSPPPASSVLINKPVQQLEPTLDRDSGGKPITSEIKKDVSKPLSAVPSTAPSSDQDNFISSAQVLIGLIKLGVFLICLWVWLYILWKAGKNSTGSGSVGNIFCALNSLMVPGLGQFAQRRWVAGFLFFFGSSILWFVVLGWTMHIWACINAARWQRKERPSSELR